MNLLSPLPTLVSMALSAATPALEGTYILTSQRSGDAIETGIARAVAGMGFVKRPFAHLRLHVTVASPRLPEPLTYALVFRRSSRS